MNQVNLFGNITRDPQLTYLPNQTPVVEFGLAMNRKYKRQDGSKCEEVCFIDCRMFGKRAEVIEKYFSKGSKILVTGRLMFDQWEGKDGGKHSKHRVLVEQFEFVGDAKKPDEGPF